MDCKFYFNYFDLKKIPILQFFYEKKSQICYSLQLAVTTCLEVVGLDTIGVSCLSARMVEHGIHERTSQCRVACDSKRAVCRIKHLLDLSPLTIHQQVVVHE